MANPRNHEYDALEGAHGYHLNTAEDSKGDEHLYVIEFNKRLPEIKAYMKARGVSAEKAFQGVTGKPWPEGRSVELKRGDSVGFMTKDRTIRSVLGKGAIAAGAGVGGYFAAPALASAASGGGGGAGGVAGGASTAGAGSGVGAGSVGGGVLAANAAGITDAGLMATGSGVLAPLATTAIPGGVAGATGVGASVLPVGATSSLTGTGALTAAGTGGSTINRLMNAKDALGNVGDLGNSIANDEARNRTQRGNWAQNYDRIRLAGNADDRQMESDAMRKAAQTSYIMGGGNPYRAPLLRSGQTVDLGYGPKAPSQFEQTAAKTLQDQLLARLSPEGHFKPTPLDSYAKAGTLENVGRGVNYGTAGINIAKGIWDIYRG